MIKKVQPKEVLLGLNKDEGSYLMAYTLPGFNLGENFLTRQQFLEFLIGYTGSYTASLVFTMYVSLLDVRPGKFRDALENVITDAVFVCPTEDFALR